jgi:hypothetical protein
LIWLALQPEPPAQARTSILACGHHGVIGMIFWSPAGTAGCRYWRCSPLASSPVVGVTCGERRTMPAL